jgi:hypothetical protein
MTKGMLQYVLSILLRRSHGIVHHIFCEDIGYFIGFDNLPRHNLKVIGRKILRIIFMTKINTTCLGIKGKPVDSVRPILCRFSGQWRSEVASVAS